MNVLRFLCFLGLSGWLVGAAESGGGKPVEAVQRFGETGTGKQLGEPFGRGGFELGQEEVVVFVGQANLVREQKSGEIEARLAVALAPRRPRFRSMAWEADTVYEQWRDLNFGSWREQLEAAGATVIIAQFGQMEALDGVGRLPAFVEAYGQLLDQFAERTRRVVLLSPIPFEAPLSRHLPDLSGRNEEVRRYVEAIGGLARQRGALFVDLFTPLVAAPERGDVTENGLHLSSRGLEVVGDLVVRQLGLRRPRAGRVESVRPEVVEKNRLWFDCWRPMNWAFAYGDRTHVEFGRPPGEGTWLKQELERFKPLLLAADGRIQSLALGRRPAPVESGREGPGEAGLPSTTNLLGAPAFTVEAERASFTVADHCEVSLFASEADGVVKPTQMVWDERGRLWVACAPSYPQVVPGSRPADYILVCEDRDGDGQVDRSWKFAEGLFMPQGLELAAGGVFVCNSTELLWLGDRDGDGRADERRVVLSGFGTGDSHQLINSLIQGPDGSLWFTQGLHILSRVETPWGIARLDRSGVWRLRPRTLRLDGFFNGAKAGHNCWGVAFDDFGQVFHKSGDRAEGYYTVPGMMRVDDPAEYHPRGALFRSPAKTTALDLIGTSHWPAEYQGSAVLGGFIAGEVEVHRVLDDDSGFRSEPQGKLLKSSSDAFRPVDVSVGPDGGIYVADWFNPIIGHYQTSYRDPRRDQTRGRVWRITAKGRPLASRLRLESMSARELVDQLASSERWVRFQAKRLLFWKPAAEVVAAADAWVAASGGAGGGSREGGVVRDRQGVEVMGVYEAHEVVRTNLLNRLAGAADPRVRAYAMRVVGGWADRLPDVLDRLRAGVVDGHPRVRLEAVVACSYVASPRALEVALGALELPRDRFLDYALENCVRALRSRWQPALARGEIDFGGNARQLSFALQVDAGGEVLPRLRDLVGSGRVAGGTRTALLVALVNVGRADDLRFAFEQGAADAAVLEELAVVARVRGVRPSGELGDRLTGLMRGGDMGVRAAAVRLAGAWGETRFTGEVLGMARAEGEAEPVRVAALGAAARLDPQGCGPMLVAAAGSGASTAVRGAALAALSEVNLAQAAGVAVKGMGSMGDEGRMGEWLRPLLGRKGGAEALAVALEQAPPGADAVKLTARVLASAGRGDARLAGVLQAQLGVTGEAPPYTPEALAEWVREAGAGDAGRGREVFRSSLANCGSCHRVNGEGGLQGPDLTSVGAALTPEQIVESVLWPKRQVKEGYLSTEVETRQGDYVQGYRVRETGEELVLREPATGREVRLRKADVAGRREAGTIMPEGLTAGMTRQEVRDLLRYLMELGAKR